MGLKVGDRLTHVGDRAVSSTKDVLAGLDSAFGDKSQVLFVEFERDGKRYVRGLALTEEHLARKEGRLGVGLAKVDPSPRVPTPSQTPETPTPVPMPPPPMEKTPEPSRSPTPRVRVQASAHFGFRELAEDSKTMSLLNRCATCHGVADGNQRRGRFTIGVEGISIEGFFDSGAAARYVDSRVEEMAARLQPPGTLEEIQALRQWLQVRSPKRRKE